MSSRYLVVLPDDSAQPILDAIGAASRSLRVKMFVFSDPALTEAVIAARRRGVKVRVMLNPARRSGEEENEKTRKQLTHGGIEVVDSNPDFHLTHEKSMVVDDETAFVKSLNWATKNLSGTRDYAVVTSHKHEVGEIVDCFEADWHRKRFHPGRESHLIWCPGGRDRITSFIDRARHTLFLQNERYQDTVVIEHLVRASRRAVKVHIMTRPPHTLKEEKLVEGVGGLRIMDDVGIKIHKLKHLSFTPRCSWPTASPRSWGRSISLRAASTTAASWPSKCGTRTWWNGSTRSPVTTGSTRIPSTCPTRGSSPISRIAPQKPRGSASSTRAPPRTRRSIESAQRLEAVAAWKGRALTSRFMTSTCTGSPFWFSVVVRHLMKPWPGRLLDARASRTSASTCSSSPGRTGRGHFSSSARDPMIPPAGRNPLSTRSRMVSAAVCQPLAARPPKNEPRAAWSSRWNGCGSNCAAKALMAAESTRSAVETNFCPGAKSSR